MKITIVEDDPHDLADMALCLRSAGHAVCEILVDSSSVLYDVIAAVEQSAPDTLFIDHTLSRHFNGGNIVERISINKDRIVGISSAYKQSYARTTFRFKDTVAYSEDAKQTFLSLVS